jgi:hypothetical protein
MEQSPGRSAWGRRAERFLGSSQGSCDLFRVHLNRPDSIAGICVARVLSVNTKLFMHETCTCQNSALI